jgi:transposase
MDDSTDIDFRARPRERVDIRIGTERRRRWGREEKLRIVRESLEPNAMVSVVARRNEIAPSLIYVWRRQALAGLIEGFHQVRVVPEARELNKVLEAQPPLPAIECTGRPSAEAAPPEPSRAAIEVTLPNGTVVRVDGAADAKALRAVLCALVER